MTGESSLTFVRALTKVISGGQTGVDQAALRAAKACGLEIGGWCPPGRVCETGVISVEFPLRETERDRSPDAPEVARSQRTEWNVRDSDGTLVLRIGISTTPGTTWTVECAKRYQRPLLICDVNDSKAEEKILQWLSEKRISILNVAGPSELESPGIGEKAYALMKNVLPANTR